MARRTNTFTRTFTSTCTTVFILFSLLSLSVTANEKKIELLDIQQPRLFGYQIGDKFERVIDLKLNLPYVLDEQNLPKAGRITEWLSLEEPTVTLTIDDGVPHYKIKLIYQIINIKPELKDIAVPSHMLPYMHIDSDRNTDSSSKEEFNAHIPAVRIGISALRNKDSKSLEVDQKPTFVEQNSKKIFLYLALLIASVIGFLYLKFGLPVFNKNHPFAMLFQSLKSQRHKAWSNESLSEALQDIHNAFNTTANKTVFSESLEQFFEEHKRLEPLKTEITEFYSESRSYFFEGKTDHKTFKYSRDDLISFAQKCSELERGIN